MSYITTVLADSPSLLWRLNDTSGTTAADATGNGNAGSYTGTFTLNDTPATPYGDDAVLLGSGGFIGSSLDPFVASSARTYEGWAYATADPTNKALAGGSSNTGPQILFLSATEIAWVVQNNGSFTDWLSAWPGLNEWVYWVVTWNDSSTTSQGGLAPQTAELFINAVSQGQKHVAQSYSATPGNYQAGGVFGSNGFPGMLAGAAIYTSILTPTQITNHFNAATGPTNPAIAPQIISGHSTYF